MNICRKIIKKLIIQNITILYLNYKYSSLFLLNNSQ